ncbi:hypothetical protein R3W88_002035 [Solanum pinnatisectum]|uniref:DC1 domain-containing protein n=1 Tax=Solanum pinnatisectum TaxID=50273 RepID=A0AAV9MJZ6_9SOLN|nr:hypothetical protein R3W88_002035 [Solanum pinnatisectum]
MLLTYPLLFLSSLSSYKYNYEYYCNSLNLLKLSNKNTSKINGKKKPYRYDIVDPRTFQDNQVHFSHPHVLKLVNPTVRTLTCNACEQQNNSNKPFYGCNSCQYFLHENCLNAPRFLDHSSHPSHPLTLLPIPTYLTRSFLCNACGSSGNEFSFSCARCQFDIHVQCASCPCSLLIDKHPHQLELIFGSRYQDKDIKYICDICDAVMNKDNWLYYCADQLIQMQIQHWK